MNVTISPDILASDNSKQLVERGTNWLKELIGDRAAIIDVEWDQSKSRGAIEDYRVTLRQNGTDFRASKIIGQDDLQERRSARRKFVFLYDDLLRQESHYLLKKLEEPVAEAV